MPNIKSQKKRVITAKKENDRNKAVKSSVKTAVKKAEAALAANDENSKQLVNEAVSSIDKAAGRGVIHKNTAARKKAAIAKKTNG